MHKTSSIIVIGLLLCTLSVSGVLAQGDELKEAFAQSYALEAQKDYVKATRVLKQVFDQQSYELNLRLGWLNYLSGQYSESLKYYQTAAALMPCSVEAKLGCVLPASALGNWSDVIDYYYKVLEIDPHNCQANYYMGLIGYNNRDYERAYKYLKRVVDLYPFDHDGVILFAWCNYQLAKKDQARVLFTRALLAVPDDRSALEGLKLLN